MDSIASSAQCTTFTIGALHGLAAYAELSSNPLINLLVAIPEVLISSVEAIIGLALTIIFGSLAIVFSNDTCKQIGMFGLTHAAMGIVMFTFSAGNIITLGFLGRAIPIRIQELAQEFGEYLKSFGSRFMGVDINNITHRVAQITDDPIKIEEAK